MVRVKTKQVFISYHSWLDSWSDGGVWGRGLLRIPQWQRQSQECRNLGTLGKLWIFCTTNVHFPDENAIHIWIKYILPAFPFQNILKAFCLLFQNAYKPSFCPSVSGLGWVNMLVSPQLWAVAVTDMELSCETSLRAPGWGASREVSGSNSTAFSCATLLPS